MQILKNIIKSVPIVLLLFACSNDNQYPNKDYAQYKNSENAWYEEEVTIKGNALGTYFIVKTSDDSLLISPLELEEFFTVFNHELSTYDPHSLISQFNEKGKTLNLNQTHYFKKCFELSQEIHQKTNGAFDPTVFPLINLWGFIKKIQKVPTQEEVDSVLAFTGFESGKLYQYEAGILEKTNDHVKLVFNAIAKGQAVDEIARILEDKGQENYYVEIGGELKVKGLNDRNSKWLIGIDEPLTSNSGLQNDERRPIENYIEITDKAMATSGNYRDFYELDGEIYGHTISPVLGRPIKSNILSATVIADEVAVADAFATAIMVLGVDSTLSLLKNHPELNIDVYLLFENIHGNIERAYTKGMLLYLLDK